MKQKAKQLDSDPDTELTQGIEGESEVELLLRVFKDNIIDEADVPHILKYGFPHVMNKKKGIEG